jgi:hypothetical protein
VIVIKLQGGLGNQMFQYAFARTLADTRQEPLLIDNSFYEQEIPGVDTREIELQLFPAIRLQTAGRWLASSFYQYSRWDNRLRKYLGVKKRTLVREANFRYDPTYQAMPGHLLLDGLFQSEKYFSQRSELIAETFRFLPFAADDVNSGILRQIQSSLSVSVHVRRGDYVKFATTNAFHGTCTPDYYVRGIRRIKDRFPDARFFFFSDDPDWVRTNLAADEPEGVIVSGNSGKDSWKDLCLMSHCKHHIIANSSFSWWGAWLNRKEGKTVIAPEKWFRTTDPFYDTTDLLPAGWVKLPND